MQGLTQNNSESSDKPVKSESSKPSSSSGGGVGSGTSRVREPPDRGEPGPPPKRPRPAAPPAPSPVQITNNRRGGGGSHHGGGGDGGRYSNDDDDIQEVVPVKAEPRDPAPASVTAMAPVEEDAAATYQGAAAAGGQQLALDDQYQDDSYDYGDYGEGYDDGSGMIDPNTGMPMAGGADGNKGKIALLFVRKHYFC